jgi:hypothetical protein
VKGTATRVVREMGELHLEGNVIPHIWYRRLTTGDKHPKPDMNAITILAEILYWYRPRYEKDEATGEVVSVNRKFKDDKLQRTYRSFAKQFGMGMSQVQRAIARLKDHGLITLELRTITTQNGEPLSNRLFIEPVILRVRQLCDPQEDAWQPLGKDAGSIPSDLQGGYAQQRREPRRKAAGTCTETSTESTTESTPENTSGSLGSAESPRASARRLASEPSPTGTKNLTLDDLIHDFVRDVPKATLPADSAEPLHVVALRFYLEREPTREECERVFDYAKLVKERYGMHLRQWQTALDYALRDAPHRDRRRHQDLISAISTTVVKAARGTLLEDRTA